MDGWSGWCPDCRRNDELANEQRNIAFDVAEEEERAQARLQQDSHIKDVIRKLLDLALESLENTDLAEKKVKVIMQSATFTGSESDFWPEVMSNSFLADCYYRLRLGDNPSEDAIASLPVDARNFLMQWAESYSNKDYSNKAKSNYSKYRAQRTEEENKKKEADRQQRLKWEKENAALDREREKQRNDVEAIKKRAEITQRVKVNAFTAFHIFLYLITLLSTVLLIPLTQTWTSFNWIVWVIIVGVWGVFLFKYCKEEYLSNYKDSGHCSNSYRKEKYIGLSKRFGDTSEPPFFYELIFTIGILILPFKYLESGAPRIIGLVGFLLILMVRPLRRISHYAVMGVLTGFLTFFGAPLVSSLLLWIKKITLG